MDPANSIPILSQQMQDAFIAQQFANLQGFALAAGLTDSYQYLGRLAKDVEYEKAKMAARSLPSGLYNSLFDIIKNWFGDTHVLVVHTTDNQERSAIHQFAAAQQWSSRAAWYTSFPEQWLYKCRDCNHVNNESDMSFSTDWSSDGSQCYGSIGKCKNSDDPAYECGTIYSTGESREDQTDEFRVWTTFNAIVLSRAPLVVPDECLAKKGELPTSYHAKSYPQDQQTLPTDLATKLDKIHGGYRDISVLDFVDKLKFGRVKNKQ